MGEACCLRLMQADGMNDNLSGNPAMPPPIGTTVPDREGITDRHPSALPAAAMEITSRHPSALIAAGMEITSSHPSAHLAAGTGITAGTRLPASNNNRYRQTAVKAALAIFLLYKGLSMISTDRTPPQSAWRHERR